MSDLLHAKSIEVDLKYYESAQCYDKLHRAQREAPFRPIRILAFSRSDDFSRSQWSQSD